MEKEFCEAHVQEANRLIGGAMFDWEPNGGLSLFAALVLVNAWNVSTANHIGNRYYLPRA